MDNLVPQYFDGVDAGTLLQRHSERGTVFAISTTPICAWLIVNGYQPVLNRDNSTKFRGRVCIHATRKQDHNEYGNAYRFARSIDERIADAFPPLPEIVNKWSGGIVGSVEIVDVYPAIALEFTDLWHRAGYFGWKFENTKSFGGLIPCRGYLGFWEINGTTLDAVAQIEKGK